MHKTKIKPLYMTTWYSLAELLRIVENMTKQLPTENPKLLLKYVDKLYVSGMKYQDDGDEEMAYVSFMRYLLSYRKAQEQSVLFSNDPHTNNNTRSDKVKEARLNSISLAKKLNERYYKEIKMISEELMGTENEGIRKKQNSDFKEPHDADDYTKIKMKGKDNVKNNLLRTIKGVRALSTVTQKPQRLTSQQLDSYGELEPKQNINKSDLQKNDKNTKSGLFGLGQAIDKLDPLHATTDNDKFESLLLEEEKTEPLQNDETERLLSSDSNWAFEMQSDLTEIQPAEINEHEFTFLQITNGKLSDLQIESEILNQSNVVVTNNQATSYDEKYKTHLPLPSTSSNERVACWLPQLTVLTTVQPDETEDFEEKEITGSYLKHVMEIQAEDFLLIIDCQPKNKYRELHVVHPKCINVPEELLTLGMSAVEIDIKMKEESLKPESPETESFYRLWKTRWAADMIILYDYDSTFTNQKSPLATIYTVLTMLDEKFINRVSILNGGIELLKSTDPSLIGTTPAVLKSPSSEAEAITGLLSPSHKNGTSSAKKDFLQPPRELSFLISSSSKQLNETVAANTEEDLFKKTDDTIKTDLKDNFETVNDKSQEPSPKKQKVIEDVKLYSEMLNRHAED